MGFGATRFPETERSKIMWGFLSTLAVCFTAYGIAEMFVR